MRKYLWIAVVALIACAVYFTSCEQIPKEMMDTIMPDAEQVKPTEPVEETTEPEPPAETEMVEIEMMEPESEPEMMEEAEMVLIPAGEFQMGSADPGARQNQSPIHSVYVDAFYIDKYEVTNAQYAEFLNDVGRHSDAGGPWLSIEHDRIELIEGVYHVKAGYENHPIAHVTWYGAMAYAAWIGKRLPTEAEWEKAARGGMTGQKHLWGDTIDSSNANYDDSGDTTVIGNYPPNGFGLYDMAGNVWEFCLDEYISDFYANSPSQNPIAGADSVEDVINNYTSITTVRVLRGGSYFDPEYLIRSAARGWVLPAQISANTGFRCVRDVTP